MVSFFNHQTLNLVPLSWVVAVVVVDVVGQRKITTRRKMNTFLQEIQLSLCFSSCFFFWRGGNIKARVRHGMNNTETHIGALPWLAPWGWSADCGSAAECRRGLSKQSASPLWAKKHKQAEKQAVQVKDSQSEWWYQAKEKKTEIVMLNDEFNSRCLWV